MATAQIPREEWIEFFDDFSRFHAGWIVTMEVLGPDLGDQPEAEGLPLVGISADVKDRENRVEVIVGGQPDANLSRIINSPRKVRIKQSRGGKHDAVEIESEDGTTTIVHFRHVPAEQTDRQLPEARPRRRRDAA